MQYRYEAPVRGSGPIFPPGYLWLIPVWYGAAATALAVRARLPSWYLPIAVGALALAAITLSGVLTATRNNAFLADAGGIWLGLRSATRRRLGRRRRSIKQLPWPEIRQMRICYRRYGARLEIVPRPGSPSARRSPAFWRAAAFGLTALIPACYLVRYPALLCPSRFPPRYRIALCGVTPDELRRALAPLAPPTAPVTVLPRWRTRAYRRLRRQRLATAA